MRRFNMRTDKWEGEYSPEEYAEGIRNAVLFTLLIVGIVALFFMPLSQPTCESPSGISQCVTW